MKKVICLLVIAASSLSFVEPKEISAKLTIDEWNKILFVLTKYPMALEESKPIYDKLYFQLTSALKDTTKKK